MVPPQLASPLGRRQASSLFLSKVARGLVPQPFSALRKGRQSPLKGIWSVYEIKSEKGKVPGPPRRSNREPEGQGLLWSSTPGPLSSQVWGPQGCLAGCGFLGSGKQ